MFSSVVFANNIVSRHKSVLITIVKLHLCCLFQKTYDFDSDSDDMAAPPKKKHFMADSDDDFGPPAKKSKTQKVN